MKTKLLFIDFNGVISYNPFWNSLLNKKHKFNSKISELNELVFVENFEMLQEWMLGMHTSEEIHSFIEKRLGLPFNQLFSIFKNDARELDVSYKILEELQNLRSNLKVILVTDNMNSFHRFTLPGNPILEKSFDAIYNSYQTKLLKKQNNGKIFIKICEEFKVDIENTFLIDDSKSNTDLFSNLGGTGICRSGEGNVLHSLRELKKN